MLDKYQFSQSFCNSVRLLAAQRQQETNELQTYKRTTMKKIFLILLLGLGFAQAKAQSTDMVQLILDIEKLTQLKGILTDMKTGYNHH